MRWTLRAYALLLRSYPPRYHPRFADEQRQVFALLCRDRYIEKGAAGVLALWLPALGDWVWTAAIHGGNLADLLDPLSSQLLNQCGSDPAFYPTIRRQAEMLGAKLPERVETWKGEE